MSIDQKVRNLNDYRRVPPEGREYGGGLPPRGGGPYDGDMERRIAKLEDKMDSVQSALSDIRVVLAEIKVSMATKDDVASLKEGINERPTRMGLWGAVATSVVIASGVVAVIMNFGHILHG